MGSIIKKIYKKNEYKILFLGLSNSSKSSTLQILQKLIKKPPYNQISSPTLGFNTELMFFNEKSLIIWDLGGHESVREYWKCYYTNVKAIVYFINLHDKIRNTLSIDVLANVVSENSEGVIYLILFSKKDLEQKVDKNEMNENIAKVMVNRRWKSFEISYYDAFGIKDAFIWLTSQLQ